MNGRLRVAVLAGGASPEAAVSRMSASAVSAALRTVGHDVRTLDLDEGLPTQLLAFRPQVVFPVTHGTLGEDGCVQGLLEVMGLPYVGADVLASALASNKPMAKLMYRAAGLPVARDTTIVGLLSSSGRLSEIRQSIGPDVVVKPASGGSAIGVTRIAGDASFDDFVRAVQSALEIDGAALVECWVPGRDVTCGVLELGDGPAVALPPTLIEPELAAFYDFRSKYAVGGSRHTCPAPFPPHVIQRIQAIALRAHDVLGVRDLSRTDFIVGDDDEVSVLETNTLPGMTATSLYPEAAAAHGLDFPSLCDSLIRRAFARSPRRTVVTVPMPEK